MVFLCYWHWSGILVWCACSENLELCAMATARLHFLIQTRPFAHIEESGFVLAILSKALSTAIACKNDLIHPGLFILHCELISYACTYV